MTSSVAKRMSPAARLAAGVGGAAAVAVLTAACASGSSTTSSQGAAAGSPAGASSQAGGASSAGGSGGMVITTATSSGGPILTDGSGRAVYLWTKDGTGMSSCSGACAGAWPPVMASGTVTAGGTAKSGDLGSVTRPDGSKQVTYDGHPLYYYVGDSGSGMASGQGSDQFGAKWWLVSPAGGDVTASVSSFTAGGSASSAPAGHTAPASPAPTTKSAGGGWS